MAKTIGKLISWYFHEVSLDRRQNVAERHRAYAEFIAAASLCGLKVAVALSGENFLERALNHWGLKKSLSVIWMLCSLLNLSREIRKTILLSLHLKTNYRMKVLRMILSMIFANRLIALPLLPDMYILRAQTRKTNLFQNGPTAYWSLLCFNDKNERDQSRFAWCRLLLKIYIL